MKHDLEMPSKTEARIYLANQRGCTESESSRCFHTFSFGSYFNEHRGAFRNLSSFNDQTLQAGRSSSFTASSSVAVMLIPVIGNVEFKTSTFAGDLDAGEAYVAYLTKGDTLEVYNPYEREAINFLHVWFEISDDDEPENSSAVSFDITNPDSGLQAVIARGPEPFSVFIGKFKGRGHGAAMVQQSKVGAFVFVVQGAFEVEDRLLEERDGLAVWNLNELTFEALSNEAIILVIEPGKGVNSDRAFDATD